MNIKLNRVIRNDIDVIYPEKVTKFDLSCDECGRIYLSKADLQIK